MRINTSKVRLVKSSFSGLRTPDDHAIFLVSFFKGSVYTSLVSLINVMTFQENHFQNTSWIQ
jgi:hypothetical protein